MSIQQDLGGEGKDNWRFDLHILPESLWCFGCFYSVGFRSTGMIRAKRIILEHVKDTLQHFNNPESLAVVLKGMPYLVDGETGDSTRMLRLRDKYTNGGRVFQVKNPNTPFVVGYGETRRNDR